MNAFISYLEIRTRRQHCAGRRDRSSCGRQDRPYRGPEVRHAHLAEDEGLIGEGPVGREAEASGLHGRMDRVPGRAAVARGAHVGSIDFATTGEAPPIFAQAAGAPLVYVGYDPPAPEAEAILVPKDSSLKTRCRRQGEEGRAEQRLECPLSSREGFGEGGARLFGRRG